MHSDHLALPRVFWLESSTAGISYYLSAALTHHAEVSTSQCVITFGSIPMRSLITQSDTRQILPAQGLQTAWLQHVCPSLCSQADSLPCGQHQSNLVAGKDLLVLFLPCAFVSRRAVQIEGRVGDETEWANLSYWKPDNLKKTKQKNLKNTTKRKRKRKCSKVQGGFAQGSLNTAGETLQMSALSQTARPRDIWELCVWSGTDLLPPGEVFDLEVPWEPCCCHVRRQLCWSLQKHLEKGFYITPFKPSLSSLVCNYFTSHLFQTFKKHVSLAFFLCSFFSFQGMEFYQRNSLKALLGNNMPEQMQGCCLILAQVKILHHKVD